MRTTASRWAGLFLFVAVVFGAVVRFAAPALAGMPVNDGGMFYTMIGELRANGFLLPMTTSYNNLGIPFAYPPFSLYVGALLSALGIPTQSLIRWLPPLVSTFSILAFYWMAAQVLDSRSRAAVASAVYALMPRTFSWYVMGGGLSRSFGIFFLLLTCAAAWRMFAQPGWRRLLLTVLFGAGAVLSHPETALHAAAACALIWLFRGRSARGVRDAALTALGIALLTAPWWGTVITRYSFAPFASALHTGAHNGTFLVAWLRFDFAQEPFLAVLTALGLVGLAVQCVRRQWFLPAWTLLPFVVEPRSAPAIAALPLAILAALGLVDLLLPGLSSVAGRTLTNLSDWDANFDASASARVVTGVVLLYAFFGAFAYDLSLARLVVPSSSLTAMEWARQNSPADARFLVLSGASDPFADAAAEWFPALTGRTSVSTVQGREWILGPAFMTFLASHGSLERCLDLAPTCLDAWAGDDSALAFDYVWVQGGDVSLPILRSVPLARELSSDPRYQLVYDRVDVAIFQRK